MNYSEQYQSRLGTLEGAPAMTQSGGTIATPIYGNELSYALHQSAFAGVAAGFSAISFCRDALRAMFSSNCRILPLSKNKWHARLFYRKTLALALHS